MTARRQSTLPVRPAVRPWRAASRWLVALGCACLMTGAGCKSMSSGIPWLRGEKSEWLAKDKAQQEHPKGEPTKLVVTWTDVMYSAPGGSPTRGFGGRVFFYNEHSQSIQVEGTLVIYTFEEGGLEAGQQPQRRYIIKPEQLAEHYTPSELGPSYSVWVPWDAVGGPEKSVTLLPKFISNGGRTIVGDQAKHVLAGKKPSAVPAPAPRPVTRFAVPPTYGVQPVSYEEPVANAGAPAAASGESAAAPGVLTTTITMPPSLQRTLGQGGAAVPGTGALPVSSGGVAAGYALPAGVALPVATAPVQEPGAQSPVRSPLATRRALGAPIERPSRDRGPWRPSPVGLPLAPTASLPAAP